MWTTTTRPTYCNFVAVLRLSAVILAIPVIYTHATGDVLRPLNDLENTWATAKYPVEVR